MHIAESQPSEPNFRIGAAEADITPKRSMFLYGYPHVERMSTGTLDPLQAAGLYLDDGQCPLLMLSADVIALTQPLVTEIRRGIHEQTGLPEPHILLAATHTHSGPVTVKYTSNAHDPIVPDPDPDYLADLTRALIDVGCRSVQNARHALLHHAVADGRCTGTNRRDPQGPADPDVPVLLARDAASDQPIGLLFVCAMHPTVLHEDSTQFSGDFPGFARQHLRANMLGGDCPVIALTGVCGNLSPRHVTRANTPAEAHRIGGQLADAITAALQHAESLADPADPPTLAARTTSVDLPLRDMPSVEAARSNEQAARDRLETLRNQNAPRTDIRTAEVDWFGAEETLTLAEAAATGTLQHAAAEALPAEIQTLHIGPVRFVGWPGELFVEFARTVKQQHPGTYLIGLANGHLNGYVVTAEAVEQAAYEAGNAIFASPESGNRIVQATLDLLADNSAPTPKASA